MIDDGTMIALITALFSLSYIGTWAVYKRVNAMNTVIKILCREHSKNHGMEMIEE